MYNHSLELLNVVSAQLESGKGPPLLTRDQRLVQINNASSIRKQRQLRAQQVKRKHQEAKAEQQLAMVGCKSVVAQKLGGQKGWLGLIVIEATVKHLAAFMMYVNLCIVQVNERSDC